MGGRGGECRNSLGLWSASGDSLSSTHTMKTIVRDFIAMRRSSALKRGLGERDCYLRNDTDGRKRV